MTGREKSRPENLAEPSDGGGRPRLLGFDDQKGGLDLFPSQNTGDDLIGSFSGQGFADLVQPESGPAERGHDV